MHRILIGKMGLIAEMSASKTHVHVNVVERVSTTGPNQPQGGGGPSAPGGGGGPGGPPPVGLKLGGGEVPPPVDSNLRGGV